MGGGTTRAPAAPVVFAHIFFLEAPGRGPATKNSKRGGTGPQAGAGRCRPAGAPQWRPAGHPARSAAAGRGHCPRRPAPWRPAAAGPTPRTARAPPPSRRSAAEGGAEGETRGIHGEDETDRRRYRKQNSIDSKKTLMRRAPDWIMGVHSQKAPHSRNLLLLLVRAGDLGKWKQERVPHTSSKYWSKVNGCGLAMWNTRPRHRGCSATHAVAPAT